jgi:hypothetical protein
MTANALWASCLRIKPTEDTILWKLMMNNMNVVSVRKTMKAFIVKLKKNLVETNIATMVVFARRITRPAIARLPKIMKGNFVSYQ